MTDARLSYLRLLIGDNKAPYTYTDTQLKALIAVPQPTSALPDSVKTAAILAFHAYPAA